MRYRSRLRTRSWRFLPVTTRAILTLGALALSSSAFAQQSNQAQFRDWQVVCESDGYCQAATKDQSNAAGPLIVGRANQKNAVWEISVETKTNNPSRLGPTSVRIPGQRTIRLSPNRDFRAFGKPNHFSFVNSAFLQPFFRRMIESRRAFFTFDGQNGGAIRASYSLNGLSSALARIDEIQGKLGTTRVAGPPVERKADRQVTETTIPKSRPVDSLALAEKLHLATLDREICSVEPVETYALGTPVVPLNDETDLVLIPCYAAAYNFGFRIFTVDKTQERATLQLWAVHSSGFGWSGTDVLANVAFDDENKQLHMVEKDRGLGDCGVSATWQWTNAAFKLLSFREKNECDGQDGEWPEIFKATQN